MSVLTSVGILIIVALIMVFLQLVPGAFMLFSHYAFGKFASRKASDQALFFILGAETGVIFFFIATYCMLTALYQTEINFENGLVVWMMSGMLVALGILFAIYYYQKGDGTKLFISRNLALRIREKAMSAKLRSDAFVLGFSVTIPELIFTIPLYVLASMEIMRLGGTAIARAGMVMAFVIVAMMPLIVMHGMFGAGRNLAELEKMREKNKNFYRAIVTIFYILLAGLLIMFRIVL